MAAAENDAPDGHVAKAQEFYDTEAQRYEALRYQSRAGRRQHQLHCRILEEELFRHVPSSGRVLEIGCGTGRFLRAFSTTGPALFGIDVSAGMLGEFLRRQAEEAPDQTAAVSLANAHALPFPDNSFDGIYAIFVLNLMPELDPVMAEIRRVLVPGGHCVFNLPNLSSLYGPGGAYVNAVKHSVGRNASGFRFSRWYTRAQMLDLLRRHRLEFLNCRGQSKLADWTDRPASLPGHSPYSWLCKSLFLTARTAD